jgi:carbon-monoxide dehydrogenase medium subunit
MPIEEYFKPDKIEEVHELVTSSPIAAKLSAGCTDLTIRLSQNDSPPTRLVSLKKISELQGIKETGDEEVFIGAAVSHAEISQSPLLLQLFPALAKASGLVAAPSIRNMGTIGGNICNASPSADTAPPLMAYDARAVIWNATGERTIPIQSMFAGPSLSSLQTGEILEGFLLTPQPGFIAGFEKLGIRKAMEIALVNACIGMHVNADNECTIIRIALGAVAPTPMRAIKAEAVLIGNKVTPGLIKETAAIAMGEIKPITDIRASAGYRTKMVGSLVEKMLHHLASIE